MPNNEKEREMQKRIWITWETQRRSIELAKKFGCELYVIEKKGVMRYPISIIKTLFIIYRTKPDVLFVQNPSMILATVACLYKILMGTPVVVDRHTTFLLNKKDWRLIKVMLFKLLHRFTIRYADITIVTNDYLATLVRELRGLPFILPDMIPELTATRKMNLQGNKNILFITSFGADEPIGEVLNAMRYLTQDNVVAYITGNFKKIDESLVLSAPTNVIFTGFLEEQNFINMLFSVDCVMVLTTADACMLCGCYEAVSAGKPLITSDKDVLNKYFTGAVFVDETESGICAGIKRVIEDIPNYQDKISKLKHKLIPEWERRYFDLEQQLFRLSLKNH
jgi:glycosyltransferase involved in cell wall biosynthesis